MKSLQERICCSNRLLKIASFLALVIVFTLHFIENSQLKTQLDETDYSLILALPLIISAIIFNKIASENVLCRNKSKMTAVMFIIFAMLIFTLISHKGHLNEYQIKCPIYSDTSDATFQIQLNYMLACLFIVASCLLLLRSLLSSFHIGTLYYAFLLHGIAGFFYPALLFIVIVEFYFYCANSTVPLWKSSLSAILGLLTPYWLAIIICYYVGAIDVIPRFIHSLFFEESLFNPAKNSLFSFTTAFNNSFDNHCIVWAYITYVTIIGIVSTVHLIQHNSEDNCHVRRCFRFFETMFIVTLMLTFVFPSHALMSLILLSIYVCPLSAHFFALTSTRFSSIFLLVMSVLLLVLLSYNLWKHLLISL